MNSKHKLPATLVLCAGHPTKFYLVSTIDDASDFLFIHWTGNDSIRWLDAMNQCALAAAGTVSVESATSTFVAAIRAAGMRVDPAVLM